MQRRPVLAPEVPKMIAFCKERLREMQSRSREGLHAPRKSKESARAHSYFFSKEVQKSCQVWLLTLWLLTFWLLTLYFRAFLTFSSGFVHL